MQRDLVDHLQERGLTRMEAQRWSTFIAVALDLLEHAARTLARSEGWDLLLKKVGSKSLQEPDVTTELYALVQFLQERSELTSSRREVHVKCEDPVISENRSGKRSKAADFAVSTLRHGSALRFVIEAKMLRDFSDIQSAYLGKDGIGCFTNTDSPYTREAVAGMIAYVRDRTEAEWGAALENAFAGLIRGSIRGHGRLHVISGGPAYLFCDVDRTALRLTSLLLLHQIFVFPS
jgi:hypothetical protein